MNVPSSTSPSSTFWIIDTTSVSGTFTTTANFTLWVPLNTPFTSSAPSSSSTYKASATENSTPRSYTPVIAGSVIGSILGTLLVLLSIVLFYRRRARPRLVLPRTRPPVTPSGSEHALLDLTAEPAPHPENIEPWVAPAVVRRPAKGREEAVRDQAWVEDTSGPRVEGIDISGRAGPSTGIHGPRAALQGSDPSGPAGSARPHIQGTETQGATAAAPAATGHGPVQEPSQSQPRLHLHQPEIPSTSAKTSATPRRRAVREPSPPRVEEDAGISLMRAEEEVLPPSYGDLVHDRLPPGSG